jgi:hypothetical protein
MTGSIRDSFSGRIGCQTYNPSTGWTSPPLRHGVAKTAWSRSRLAGGHNDFES